MELFPFVAGSYNSRSKKFDCQRTVNLYPEASGSGNSKSIAMLIGTPGTRYWYQGAVNDGPIRGSIRFTSEIAIVVTRTQVLKFDTAGNATLVGNVPASVTPVSMASNGTIVMLVTGPNGYAIDPVAGTMTSLAGPDFHGADRVDFIDGYFVFNWPGTQKYQITQLYSTVIDPLDFASAEGAPDLLVSLIVANKEVLLLGETSTEFHANSGNVDFPFEAIQGAFIGMGCAAKNSVAKLTDANGQSIVCWLTANADGEGQIVRTVGYQPQRISDHALEYQIGTYERIDDAVAYTYQQEGHQFYVISFPTAQKTWCYDFTTELWHERMYRNTTTGADEAHRGINHMFFAGKHLIGDRVDANILEFDLDKYTDANAPLVSIRQCPHLAASDAWQIFHEVWFDMETGVGLIANDPITNTGTDPKMLVEWSDDGGSTFPSASEVRLGRIGERFERVSVRRTGKSLDRVFRSTISDPVKRCFYDAGVRVTVGNR